MVVQRQGKAPPAVDKTQTPGSAPDPALPRIADVGVVPLVLQRYVAGQDWP